MTPQLQLYRQGGRSDNYGDCHRTCIAMILNMHRDDVPHFMDGIPPGLPADDQRYKDAESAELRWLAKRRITAVNVAFPGEVTLAELLNLSDVLHHSAPVILGCTSRNQTNHSVVIKDGLVYNPNPDGPIVGPMRDGFWWLTIYSVGMRWRSPLWRDRLRTLFRVATGQLSR